MGSATVALAPVSDRCDTRPCTPIPGGVCGRYANTKRPVEIDEHFGVPVRGDMGTHRFNISPTEELLVEPG